MVLSLTYKCSLGCPHCFMTCDSNGDYMNMETLKCAIKFYKKSKRFALLVSGGEPTQHPEFIRLFLYILSNCNGKRIILLTNGQWLSEPFFTQKIIKLQRKHRFFIQITSVPGLYPNYQKIKDGFIKVAKNFIWSKTSFEEKLNIIDDIGRARGKDFSYLGGIQKRSVPSCHNVFAAAKIKHISSLQDLMRFMDNELIYGKCKPLIDCYGDIYPGESVDCKIAGNVKRNSCDDIFKFFRDNMPCGRCGVGSIFNG